MKNPKTVRPARALWRATPVAAAAATLLCGTGAALAQAQPTTEVITITGIRRGIESAISVKKNADGVVEAISAEDIGKLPDTTIAESLARLPGLTTQRTRDGQASTITIRGLGADFNGYLLNGREQASTGDSRAVDLSVYPAELIGGATVYKTGDATLMGAGLAGTIDNKLIDPLSFPGRVLAVNASKGKTGRGLPVEGDNKRFSLSYIDQFADRKVGIALGFVRVDGTANQLETGGWGSATVDATLANGQVVKGVRLPDPWGNGMDYKNRRTTDKRDGAAAIITFKPNKDLSSQLDLFYSKINDYVKIAEFQGGLGTNITNATVVNGEAVKGTFAIPIGPAGNGLIARSEGIQQDDKIVSAGWRTEWAFAPTWKGTFDVSHNSAKRVERDIEAYAGMATTDTLTFDNTGGGTPQFTLGKPLSYTDPSLIKVRDQTGWSGVNYADGTVVPQAGYAKGPDVTDKVTAARLDFRKDLAEGSMFTDLQFGVNYSKRTKERFSDEGLVVADTATGRGLINFPADAYVENNIGGTGINMLTFDPKVGLWPGARIQRKYNDDILSKTWTVEEKVTTAFLKANVDTTVGKLPVRGNVGVQVVNTDQSSAGYRAQVGSSVTLNNPAGELRTDGTKYTDVLPTMNLSSDLGGGNIIRLGAGQQIARATLTDLRNSFAASVSTDAASRNFGRFVGSAGNPNLKPFKAKALDLSYEKYFKGGYVSVAGFYKKLDTYITTVTDVNYDFSAYAQQLGLVVPPAGAKGEFTTPTNGNGGNLSGVELAASVPFGNFVSLLNGFGATASYSYTDSSVKLPDLTGLNPNQPVPTTGSMTLPGLSKENTKAMLYYEGYGFSAFIAHNQRTSYIGPVANDATGGYPTLKRIQGSSWVSAQIGYEFQQGYLKGLGLRLEGNNLNKPVYRQLKPDGSIDSETRTGASVFLKVLYKLQ